jgi:beta-ketoacyl-acyl-carrier-protein synthase II
MQQRRVVITGLGVLACNGIGKESFWNACISGRSGIRRITRFDASNLPTQIAGEILDFDPSAFALSPEECATMDRATQLAIAAAHQALQDANLINTLNEEERNNTGVYIGSAMGALGEGEQIWLRLTDSGAHPLQMPENSIIAASLLMPHAPAAVIAARHHLHGPSMVIGTGCSAGGDAIGEAFWAIQEGYADRMLAGGADATITYAGMDAFCVVGAMSTRNDSPERASRPYDQGRDGFVMAEGAGILLLEEREKAIARNAHIYAEIIGFTTNMNAYHMTSLPQGGVPLQKLLEQALAETQLTPYELDYINSHGSSTPPNEVAETAAYKAAFGKHAYHIPISATKSMIGHAQGAASAIEAVVTTLTLEHQIIPPTINQEQADPRCDLDYVPNVARAATVNIALTHSSGFGGVNSALTLVRPDWVEQHQ